MVYSPTVNRLNSLPCLLLNQSKWIATASILLNRCHWMVLIMLCYSLDLPSLESIQLSDYAFAKSHSFELQSLPSLFSIIIGESCFSQTRSFSLVGICESRSMNSQIFRPSSCSFSAVIHSIAAAHSWCPIWRHSNRSKWEVVASIRLHRFLCQVVFWANASRTDLPRLRSIELDDSAFANSKSFQLISLPSLQSIVMDDSCFTMTPSFSLIGGRRTVLWQYRPSSASLC